MAGKPPVNNSDSGYILGKQQEFDRRTASSREGDVLRSLLALRRREDRPATREEIGRTVPAFPLKLQVQTHTGCNSSCAMCPGRRVRSSWPRTSMSLSLYRRIIDECRPIAPERLGLFLMNEPLLDSRLPDWVARARDALPETELVLYTNGALLDGKVTADLVEAGVDEVSISVQGMEKKAYETRMKGLSFDTLMHNLSRIASELVDGRIGRARFFVTCLGGLEEDGRTREWVRFWESRGLPVTVGRVSNRAGNVDVDDSGDENRDRAPVLCPRPFVKMYITAPGDVILCNCDWRWSVIVGSLRESSIREIWSGERLMSVRTAWICGERQRSGLCSSCDYPAILRGGIS